MTMTPGELERKVRQLDNDVQSIYEMLAGISAQQARQGNRLDSIDGRLDSIDGRLDSMGSRFDAMDTRFDAMDSKLDALLSRHDGR